MKKRHTVIGGCSVFVILNYVSYIQTGVTVIDLISKLQA